jgi:hypothetical protein
MLYCNDMFAIDEIYFMCEHDKDDPHTEHYEEGVNWDDTPYKITWTRSATIKGEVVTECSEPVPPTTSTATPKDPTASQELTTSTIPMKSSGTDGPWVALTTVLPSTSVPGKFGNP